MKRIFILFFLFAAYQAFTFAQFNPNPYGTFNGVNVFVCKDLSSESITFSITGTDLHDLRWKSYTTDPALSTEVSEVLNGTSITLDNMVINATAAASGSSGYVLEIDGIDTYYIYVFDYSKYASLPLFDESLIVSDCEKTSIPFTSTFNPMTYYGPGGITGNVPRNAVLSYQSLKWDGEVPDFVPYYTKKESTNIQSGISRTENLNDIYREETEVWLYGDQFAKLFKTDSVQTTVQAVKPLVKAWGIITQRNALNELDVKDNPYIEGEMLEGSAPVEMTIKAYSNTLSSGMFNYRWQVVDLAAPSYFIAQANEPEFQYTFNKSGNYKAVVEVTTFDGLKCKAKDSIISIKVWESQLEVPKVFTPNDDGINDEFRVAYKSLVKYNIWVYNRWGKLVYSSSNPEKGWDGNIGKAKAATGAYFYVIEATGSDDKKYKKSGDINLLR